MATGLYTVAKRLVKQQHLTPPRQKPGHVRFDWSSGGIHNDLLYEDSQLLQFVSYGRTTYVSSSADVTRFHFKIRSVNDSVFPRWLRGRGLVHRKICSATASWFPRGPRGRGPVITRSALCVLRVPRWLRCGVATEGLCNTRLNPHPHILSPRESRQVHHRSAL